MCKEVAREISPSNGSYDTTRFRKVSESFVRNQGFLLCKDIGHSVQNVLTVTLLLPSRDANVLKNP